MSPAAADQPERQPNELPTEFNPFTDTACEFPVNLRLTANKETITTFAEKNGVTAIHTTGALKARFTNAETKKTIDRNISGPILATTTTNSDGSTITTQKTTGLTLWLFDEGVAPEFPSRLVITRGKTESVIGPGTAFTFIGHQGSFEDICAALR
jgi:hypothetical protein